MGRNGNEGRHLSGNLSPCSISMAQIILSVLTGILSFVKSLLQCGCDTVASVYCAAPLGGMSVKGLPGIHSTHCFS